ncbi:sushi, von Willebrand factor type A, EGF and pentraxin domain-containing protein 1-like [Halichondria panicea]|uniref:sushi, von Willebrand factor type A, EGF and pentraxin domain-containing protein 1-like n=1 Tax=Halichondria panicea TaxID=6063 RepID=UPI00312B71F4
MEMGHEYEEVSKFQQAVGGEYEIIRAPSQTTGSESKAAIKTESSPPTPPTPPTPQPSQVTKAAGNDIEFTEDGSRDMLTDGGRFKRIPMYRDPAGGYGFASPFEFDSLLSLVLYYATNTMEKHNPELETMLRYPAFHVDRGRVYLSLGSTNITTNNTEIPITDIGDYFGNGCPSLICHTDLVACCTPYETMMARGFGLWRYPNGARVPGISGPNSAYRPFVSFRNVRSIQLIRSEYFTPPPLSPTGSYCCIIPTIGGEMTFCANLVVCLSLPALKNGIVSYNDSTLGLDTLAIYTCDTGYTLEGNITRTCERDGVWSGLAPFCEQILICSDLPLVTNGDVFYTAGFPDNRSLYSGATYTCNPGYTLIGGSTTRTCVSGGRWSGSPPTCQYIGLTTAPPITCSDLINPTNGTIGYDMGTASSRPVYTVATYTCDTGYTLNGDTTRTCRSDGIWSGSSPVCQQILICSDLPLVTNGDVFYTAGFPDNRSLYSGATYTCNPGYTLIGGSTTRTCVSGGRWSGSPPTCQYIGLTTAPPITCSDLINPTNGTIGYDMGTASSRLVYTVATYTCDTGYTLNGDTTRTCRSDGIWSGSSPVCQRKY